MRWVVGNEQWVAIGNVPNFKSGFTSTKHGEKKLQSFSHCGSFNQHALQPLNNCIYVSNIPTNTLGILGLVIYRWKGLEIPFQRYVTRPKTFNFAVAKWTINLYSCLVTANQGGQKNRNGKTTVVFFHIVFY